MNSTCVNNLENKILRDILYQQNWYTTMEGIEFILSDSLIISINTKGNRQLGDKVYSNFDTLRITKIDPKIKMIDEKKMDEIVISSSSETILQEYRKQFRLLKGYFNQEKLGYFTIGVITDVIHIIDYECKVSNYFLNSSIPFHWTGMIEKGRIDGKTQEAPFHGLIPAPTPDSSFRHIQWCKSTGPYRADDCDCPTEHNRFCPCQFCNLSHTDRR